MYNKFSVEEINLMCIFNTNDRTELIDELLDGLNYIYESELRELFDTTIEKLENISDDDFSEIGFYIADEYIEETGA